VWTRDISRAHRVARKLRAGSVWVNYWDGGDMTAPFGGYKQSGNGRDKSLHAFEKYTEIKATWINLRMTWYRDPVIYEAEITALRKAEPKRFQQWIREARLMLEPLSSRYQSDREQAMRALANLGPTPELRLHGHKWSCEDGWYVDWQGDKAVRMTADVADGLLIQLDTETRSELGIWCGDGCKGIPYYLDIQSRWLRLSPVAKPAAWYPPEVPFAVEDVGVTHYDDRDVRVTALRERLLAALSDQMQLISLEEWPDHIALSIFIDGMASLPDMTDWLRDQPEIESVTQSSRMQMSGNRVRIVLEIRFKR
jgi:hypothetical protein